MIKLKAELMIVINEGSSSEDLLDIEKRTKELLDEDVVNAIKTGKTTTFLRMRDQASKVFLNLENAKKGYNEVIRLNKDNPNYTQHRLKVMGMQGWCQ